MQILTTKDIESITRIAIEAKRGKTGRFSHLPIRDISIGSFADLTEELTDKELSALKACGSDYSHATKDERAMMRSVVASFVRELRKIHGDDSGIAPGVYFKNADGEYRLVFERSK